MIADIPSTSTLHIQDVFKKQQQKALSMRNSSADERIDKLIRLREWIKANETRICEALFADFRKPKEEVVLTEITVVLSDIKHTIKNLKSWMSPKEVQTPISLLGTRSYIHYEPKGVSLIIAPWNYPFNLMLGPLVSAISAGCTAMLKPSEMTPHTAKLISECIRELYVESEVAVFEGDVHVSQALLALPFDHIFFTGSPAVGKHVMRAAAEHLSSVTLELGGKSPAIIDRNANLKDAAEKIIWGKFVNNGQTCIAPDYVLVDEAVVQELVDLMINRIAQFYGEGEAIQQSPDIARIVNDRHFQRVKFLLDDALSKGAVAAHGGITDAEDRYIAPTLLTHLREDMEIMHEEIFGPLLPILTYSSREDAVQYIHSKPKPLALYIFTNSSVFSDYFVENTSSGGVCVNEAVLHFMNHYLPFGGVNNSGIGKAHGYHGFLAFSNEKAVLNQRVGFTGPKMLYPPYNQLKKSTIKIFQKILS
jgi:aldehyde dehydrogenase (NAD+)